MKNVSHFVLLLAVLALPALAKTPVEQHGQLSVKGTHIVDSAGQPVSLAGPSFFWSNTNWQANRYYNDSVVNYLVKNWNASIIRAAIGAGMNGGYGEDPKENIARAETLIDAAIAAGIYVVVDWHAHHAEEHPEKAVEFFTHIAKKYAGKANIIYEIYNEPLPKADWQKVITPYAHKVIPAIRKYDSKNIIVVGTPSWSQDVDIAAESPLQGYSNIVYTLHFYAGTHKQELRDKATKAIELGLPLIITEWGMVNANGDGDIDKESVEEWLAFMKKHKISHCIWSLHDKKEGASMLKPGTAPDANWTDKDFTEAGLYAKQIISTW